MNQWIAKSYKLANSKGYLDKLFKVYPVNPTPGLKLSEEDKKRIRNAHESSNGKKLISLLLEFKRFPIDDPYMGFIHKDPNAIYKNPKTVKRISNTLFKLKTQEVIQGMERPKDASRQMGHVFRHWLGSLGIPLLDAQTLLDFEGTAILKGGDKTLKSFAHKELGYKRQKGLDLIFKTGKNWAMGEAKFITTYGGTQDKSFREAVAFVKSKHGKVIGIAILDGVIWLDKDNNKSLYGQLKNLKKDQVVLSALCLPDFIKSLE